MSKSKQPVRILVTAAGGALAPLNIRLLKASTRYDIWVLAVDIRSDAIGGHFADEFAQVPPGGAPDYVGAISELVQRHKIDVVMPWSDEESFALSMALDQFAQSGTTITCSSPNSMKTILDKAKTYKALEDAGLQSVRWAEAKTFDDLMLQANEFLSAIGEFVLKPTQGRGNRGALTVYDTNSDPESFEGSREFHLNAADFFSDFAENALDSGPVVIMERLQNPAYDVDVLCLGGETYQSVARERVNPAGVPFRGNLVRNDARLTDLAKQACKVLKLAYLHDCDMMLRRDGTPIIIEINPRPSGSVASSILANVPIYNDLVALACGDAPSLPVQPQEQAILPFIDCLSTSLPRYLD